jgi:hypothetical protein
VRADVQRAFNEELEKALRGSVWDRGCTSWYKTVDGRNTDYEPDRR